MYVSGVKEVQGPRSSFESAGTPLLKWGEVGQVLSLWLFRTARYTGPFLTESLLSGVMFINFTLLKSTFLLLCLIAHAGSTSRSLQT